jgi:hypothetical protein
MNLETLDREGDEDEEEEELEMMIDLHHDQSGQRSHDDPDKVNKKPAKYFYKFKEQGEDFEEKKINLPRGRAR